MRKILVTGASGFVGQALCKQLIENKDCKLRILLRSGFNTKNIDDAILQNCELVNEVSRDIDIVIHLAARVHVMRDGELDPLRIFRKINVDWTSELATAAVANKVKRFIFMSSLHVNGNNSDNKLFQETDTPNPQTPYAISKLEAEMALQDIAAKTGLETVIIRPPLVYGAKVKGNFLSLLKLINKGLPFLPVGALNNKRSYVGINNLVSLLLNCIENPKAANETFLVSDDEDISTTELIKLLAQYLNKSRPMLQVPVKFLEKIAILCGKSDIIEKLSAPLRVDISKAKELLGWYPKQSLEEGLKETVEWFKNRACAIRRETGSPPARG